MTVCHQQVSVAQKLIRRMRMKKETKGTSGKKVSEKLENEITETEVIEKNLVSEVGFETQIYISEDSVIEKLKKEPEAYRNFLMMDDVWRQKFIDFCMGKKTLPLLYDKTFKLVFNPDIHAERLGDFISQIIGRKVEVLATLPTEESFMAGDKLVIMDIIVRLDDGSIADVEIHKNPYTFAGERVSCYSSDLLLRQYSKLKNKKGKNFRYSDLKQVYTIVIYEKTTAEFHAHKPAYIHHGEMIYDTGLKINMLQQSYLIALDTFRECRYYKNDDDSRLTGWLSLLSTEDVDDAVKAVERFPWLVEIYTEIAELRGNPSEVIGMYSSMIMELDNNSIQFIVDEQKAQIEEQKEQLAEQKEQLAEKDGQLAEKNGQLAEQKEQLAEQKEQLAEQRERILELERQLAGLKS
jgi:hypothetical protein